MLRGALEDTQPDRLGRVAREAKAKQLVVTHLMPRSVPDELREPIAGDYTGPLTIGEDLLEV